LQLSEANLEGLRALNLVVFLEAIEERLLALIERAKQQHAAQSSHGTSDSGGLRRSVRSIEVAGNWNKVLAAPF